MEFNKPGPNKRVCAFFIDILILAFIQLVIVFLTKKDINWWFWNVYIIFKDCYKGKSLGKYLVELQVENLDGGVASAYQSIIRNIPMAIPFLNILEYRIMLKDANGRRLGDEFAKTQVIDLNPQSNDKSYIWLGIFLLFIFLIICAAAAFIKIKQS